MIATTLPRPQEYSSELAHDVLTGLGRKQKTLPAKWFYDAEGSRLFQEITALPEYYVTRAELSILCVHGEDIAAFAGPDAVVVEYGAGSSEKAALLARRLRTPNAYICIEIEDGAAREAAQGVAVAVPGLATRAIVGDFTALDRDGPPLPDGARVGFFPGSTLGNFEPMQATALLRSFARHLGEGARLILGCDRVKSANILVPAYDDAQGVTAAFNKNVLARINRGLGANFDLDAFAHEARWSDAERRIEMHLVSLVDQTVSMLGRRFNFARGESIHTENSYKFDVDRLAAIANAAGWRIQKTWTDAEDRFLVAGLSL